MRFSLVLALVMTSWAFVSAQDSSPDVFLEDGNAYYVAQVASQSTYEYVVTYEVYFKGDALEPMIRSTDVDGSPIFQSRSVDRLLGLGDAQVPTLSACLEDVCRPLAIEYRLGGEEGAQSFVIIEVVAKGAGRLKEGEDVRFSAPAAWVRLANQNGTERDSPALSAVFPRVGKNEKSVLASAPVFDLSLSPLTEDQKADEDSGASVYFRGGIHSFRPSHRLGWTYSGAVGTEDALAFDAIETDFEFETNLLQSMGDYLPLLITAGGETDRNFDVVNAVAGVGVQFLVPWNVNYSPPDAYIPNVGPLIQVRGEVGTRVDEDASAVTSMTPQDFQRAGYSIQWKVPVARATVLKLHHAGLWVFSDDAPDDFHKLWDVALETEIGNLTYYIGYQEGEAAPLFEPIETTQVGILIRFGKHFKCEKGSDAENDWSCKRD